jgi:hypothetical protein
MRYVSSANLSLCLFDQLLNYSLVASKNECYGEWMYCFLSICFVDSGAAIIMQVEHGSSFQLSSCTRLAYSVGHVFNDLCASMWFTYLLVFLQRVAGFSHLDSGWLLFWGQLVDALCTPVIGYLSDSYASVACWCARQKVWHIIGKWLAFSAQDNSCGNLKC